MTLDRREERIIDLKRREGEQEAAYIYRICSYKDQIGSWEDVGKILNSSLGYNYNESAYRKKYEYFNTVWEAVKGDFIQKDNYLDELRKARRELEEERYKLRDEKNEYNRWLRTKARDEMILERIIEAIKTSEPIGLINTKPPIIETDDKESAILCFGDAHFGLEYVIYGLYGEVINQYSPEIFFERMEEIFNEVVKIIKKENFKKLYVFDLGDFCDGILRVKQLMKLRYGVVEGSVKYAKFLASWLNRLTEYVNVEFQMTYGNHTELRMLGQPKGTFEDDNTGLFAREIIKTMLEDNPRFTMKINPTGYIFDTIQGLNILGSHGEETDLEKAISEFSSMYQTNINILIGAHLHHYQSKEAGRDKEVVRVTSIMGIDDFSMSIHKTATPGATLVVVKENKGIDREYRIKLK